MRNLTQPEIEVTPFSPVAQKVSQTGGAAPQAQETPPADDITTQRKLNRLEKRVMSLGKFRDRVFRGILSIESEMREDLAEGEIDYIPRIAIAKGLSLKGNEESQKQAVTRLFQDINEEQARCGRKMLTYIPGTFSRDETSSPGFVDHYRWAYQKAVQAFPHWKKSWRITDQAARWILENLPEAEPVAEREKLPPSLPDVWDRCLKATEKLGNKAAQEIEENFNSTPQAVRLIKDMIRVLEGVATSVQKTAPARRPPLNLPLHGTQKEEEAILEAPDVWEEDFEILEVMESSLFEEAISAQKEADFEHGLYVAKMPRMHDDSKGLKPSHVPTCEVENPESNLTPIGDRFQPQPEAILELEEELSWEASAEANGADPEELALEALEVLSGGSGGPLDVLFLDDRERSKLARKPIKAPSLEEARRDFGAWLKDAERLHASLALRWTGTPEKGEVRPYIQVDDCDKETLLWLRPYSCWQVRTSWRENGFQSWIAIKPIPGESQQELYTRLCRIRSRLFAQIGKKEKGNGGSYGCVRWPGSPNWKPEHRRPDGTAPLIQTIYKSPGRYVTEEDLEAAGLQAPLPAPPDTPEPPSLSVLHREQASTAMNGTGAHASNGHAPDAVMVKADRLPPPSYRIAIDKAPLKSDGKTPDWSLADFNYSVVAFKRDYSMAEVESLLRENRLSLDQFHPLATQADCNKPNMHKDYIRLTVQKACLFVQRAH